MTEPGSTWPLGVVPTTEPSFAVLLTGVGCSATRTRHPDAFDGRGEIKADDVGDGYRRGAVDVARVGRW